MCDFDKMSPAFTKSESSAEDVIGARPLKHMTGEGVHAVSENASDYSGSSKGGLVLDSPVTKEVQMIGIECDIKNLY
jgi:hypothetical protein